jgi:hypothetical protein
MCDRLHRPGLFGDCAGLPCPYGSGSEHLSIPTSDGGTIAADLYGKGDQEWYPAHGPLQSASWSKQARELQAAGFRCSV